MTIFPDQLEIYIREKESKTPIEGIAILITLFANRKNNYHLTTELSNKDGLICLSKKVLMEKIVESSTLFIMDYSSNLEDCKPFIGIEVEDALKIKKRIAEIEKNWSHYEPSIKELSKLKSSNNAAVKGVQTTVTLAQGHDIQKIHLELEPSSRDNRA